MYVPPDIADEIRLKNDIVDVINSYVPLKRSGSGFMGLCPFHNEKTPSFHVSPDRQIYHCFGCNAGGNVVTFVMEYENLNYPEAMKLLADRAGVNIPENTSFKSREEASRKSLILEALKEAAGFYYRALREPKGEQGLRYFAQRGLDPAMIKRFGLGFAGKGRDELTRYLREKGHDLNILKEAGLCIIDEKYGIRDRFFNRVMFPIQDINKRVIGFGGRVMGEGMPKYLNSPETPVFDKSRNLYGLNYARSSRQDNMILCEGYMDVIALHQAGFDQAVASLGTALTPGQASLIARITKNVYISYDSDEAGTKAALRAIDILKDAGISVKIISLEPYKDPDELIKAIGSDGMDGRLKDAQPAFSFRVKNMEKGLNLFDPDEKTVFLKRAAAYLAVIDDELERETHVNALSEKYKISTDIIKKAIKNQALSASARAPEPLLARSIKKREKQDPNLGSQKLLLAYLSDNPQIYSIIRPYISPRDFCDELCEKTAVILFEQLETGGCDPSAIVGAFMDPEESALVSGIFYEELKGTTQDPKEKSRILRDLLVKVRSSGYMRDVAAMEKSPDALNNIIKGKKDIESLKLMELKISDGTE